MRSSTCKPLSMAFLLLLLSVAVQGGAITKDMSLDHGPADSDPLLELDEPSASKPLQVHLIPHSHDDVGWLKTIDEYYSGRNDSVQVAGVQYILDSVIEEMERDANLTFSYVEVAFFKMWWSEQSEAVKETVRKFAKEGRLEFLNGGFSMNDEATTRYDDIISNHKAGQEFLKNELGVAPRIGWQLDPFGHSTTQARLFAEMGFDAIFFARADYQDKA